jgi:signal transduction histidine kinase
LAEAKALLFSSTDCEANLVFAGRLAVPALADGCVVHLQDPDGGTRVLAAFHADEARQPALHGLHRRRPEGPWEVFRSGKAELLGDAGTHYLARLEDPDEREFLERLELGSIASVPMTFHQRPLGAITLLTSRYRQRLTERDLALVEDLSQCAAAAVAYARALAEAGRIARFNDDLLGAFAHNLRNHLGSAHIWLAILRSEALGSSSRRAVERIDDSLSALNGFLSRMVDLSRMFTGRLELEKQNTDLPEIVDSVLKGAESAIEEKGLHLDTEIDRSLETLWADPYRLRQALDGLVSNAIKFTPSGGTVRVRLEKREGRARLEVEDTGVGIPAGDLAQLLLSFEKRGSVPTGLGLAIARCIAELHHGQMTGASAGEGQGSLFALEVPLDAPPPAIHVRPLR